MKRDSWLSIVAISSMTAMLAIIVWQLLKVMLDLLKIFQLI